MCGEKHLLACGGVLRKGSPPRVRGKDIKIATCRGHDGITPACAGKRSYGFKKDAAAVDHPRVCGEKTKKSVENKGISNAELCDFI